MWVIPEYGYFALDTGLGNGKPPPSGSGVLDCWFVVLDTPCQHSRQLLSSCWFSVASLTDTGTSSVAGVQVRVRVYQLLLDPEESMVQYFSYGRLLFVT